MKEFEEKQKRIYSFQEIVGERSRPYQVLIESVVLVGVLEGHVVREEQCHLVVVS